MNAPSNKSLISVGLTVIAVLVSALVFWPKPTIENTARSVAYRAFNGDGNTVLALTPASDLMATNVTIENWKKFVDIELMPRLKAMKITNEKLKMPANDGLVGAFYFVASKDGMNRDLGVGVEATGDGVVVPMSVWIGLFASVFSVVDLKISDKEVASRTKEVQLASMVILEKYGIRKVKIGSQIKDLVSL